MTEAHQPGHQARPPPDPGEDPRPPPDPGEDPRPVGRSPASADTSAKPPADPGEDPRPVDRSPASADASAKPSAITDAEAKPLPPALDKTFKIGLVLKGLDGVLEFVGGILLLFLSPQAIQHLVRVLTAHELKQDSHDLIAHYLLHTAAHLHRGTTLFGAIYLLSHGITKIVLVALVLRGKLWAYPWLIGLLLVFIVYQLYEITAVHFSAGLTALTVFDAFLVWLTWREYRAKRAQQHQARAPVSAASPGAHRPAQP
jgi:uncharacterized membrane protein